MFSHPKNVCMTYTEHMKFSLQLSKDFFIGSFKAFIHAFYPDAYITSTTDILNEMQEKLDNAGCRKLS